MIVGGGLIASALKDKEGITYFASGVSDSRETRQSEFDREEKLLRSVSEPIVYFSTVPKRENPYYYHKQRMEDIVRAKKHTIIRLPNVCGYKGNPNNLLNILKTKIKNNQYVTIYNAYRSLLDVEDLARMIPYYKEGTYTINEIDPTRVIYIAKMIARVYNTELNHSIISVYEDNATNDQFTNSIIDNLIVRKGYTKRLIKKYVKL